MITTDFFIIGKTFAARVDKCPEGDRVPNLWMKGVERL